MGNRTVELRVHVVVGIEQIELDTADIHTPYKCVYLIVAVRNIHDHLIAVLVQFTLDGQGIEILCVVFGNLLSVHGEALCEVTETIEETYGTEVDIGVGSLLEIVAGQHAQTAGIDLQRLVQTEFHTEVSD